MKALVTGGGGFLGSAIVRELRARGDEVVSYSRARHAAIEELGGCCIAGDLCDERALRDALRGVDIVFHSAARTGIFGPRAEFERTNVAGTHAVLAAARAARVTRLVHTSSPSVCFDGREQLEAGRDLPIATRFLAEYPRTKARAEAAVLAMNGVDGLATCALRPHLIVGPGDPHLMPRVVARARAGKLAIVGDGKNQVSITDVENAAHAHVLAADRLHAGAPHAGRAYFIAQEQPIELWSWINVVLERLRVPRVTRRVPLALAYAGGAALELLWRARGRVDEPPMTRFLALQLARSHTYSLFPAREDFGYEERIDLAHATERVVADLAARGA